MKPIYRFHHFAHRAADGAGSPWAFLSAVLIVLGWLLTGPMFHYSDTWQLVINTGTTVVTFLMVFLIQNAQNRDSKAVHIKLDELILAIKGARNSMMNLDEMNDDELEHLHKEFMEMSKKVGSQIHGRSQRP